MAGFAEIASFILRVFLGLIFLAAGLSKARAPAAFEATLADHRLIPAPARPFVVALLPAAEVLLGMLLVMGVLTAAAGASALGLLLVFTLDHVVRAPVPGSDCGCFGSFGVFTTRRVLLRNLALMAATLPPIAVPSEFALSATLGFLPGLLVVAAFALAALAAAGRSSLAAAHLAQPPSALSEGRRTFLGKLAVLGAGSVAASALALIRGAPAAEAACYGCTSCGYAYYWIGCTCCCCAAFWQVPQEYCAPYCYTCGSWSTVVYCGYPQCC